MEYPHPFFMLKVKQGILYDHITKRRLMLMLRNIYFSKFQSLIRYGIILSGGKLRV